MPDLIADSQSDDFAEYPYAPQAPIWPASNDSVDELLPRKFSQHFSVLAIALVVVFVGADFALIPLGVAFQPSNWGALWVMVVGGAMLAQAGLLVLLLVFGEGTFWRRLVGCWSTAIGLWAVWAVGVIVAMLSRSGYTWNRDFFLTQIAEPLQFFQLSLPLFALAIQSPLWFFRLYLGWRLRRSTTTPSPQQPLSIRDYLIGTGIAAVSLTFARLAPPSSWKSEEYWNTWAVFFGIGAGVSLLSIIPAMLLVLRLRDWRLGFCLVVLYGLTAGMLAVAITAIFDESMLNTILSGNLWVPMQAVVLFVALAVFLGAGLKAMRDMGFELVLGGNEQP